jgi:hypothetical protein
MKLSSSVTAVLPVLAALLAACSDAAGEGQLSAAWIGADTGEVSAPATAVWCRDGNRLEVTMVQEDLGIGFVLYPADTLFPGEFPAFDPGADTVVRPSVAAAIRWFTEQAIEGYQSDSGTMVVEQTESRLSGRFGFRLRALDGLKQVRLTGTLTKLVPGVCQSDSLPAAGPTG